MDTAPSGDRSWLDVSYAEKDAAKAAGARWDPAARRWYAPRPEMPALQPWAALPPVPDPLPGEDRQFGSGLFVDLVPTSCWFTNVRSCVDPRDWDRLRRMVYGRAAERCEVCGDGPDREQDRRLEAHERWDYDPTRRVQTLKRLVCLCSRCHESTHFGLAQVRGNEQRALANLMRVNAWSRSTAEAHISEAIRVWRTRSDQEWALDLSILTEAGITFAPPPAAGHRRAHAAEALDAARRRPD